MMKHWALLLLLLRVAGASLDEAEPRSFNSVDAGPQQHVPEDNYVEEQDGSVRRFECPAGFFRLRRNCYYLSGGTAQWREAHFQCTARNATLAVLNRNGKDKILRKYLMGEQFRQLERWIGGIYNWRQMIWEWGVSGDKVLFENFGKMDPLSKNFNYNCMILDPTQQYKWNARSCVEQKYFICEVPAGRIGKSRRRKNISDPLAPQNQRLRPTKDERSKHKIDRRHRNKLRSMRKKNWHLPDDNQIWVHGIKPGSRPPKGSRAASLKRQRLSQKKGPRARGSGKNHKPAEKQLAQASPLPDQGFVGPNVNQPRQLSEDEVIYPRVIRINSDFVREEILHKS